MRRPAKGFTLVELLVALVVMALLAVLSWRGLDGMTRTQQQTQARADQVLALQIGLAQWSADLDGLIELPQLSPIDWNGRVLRMTRRASAAQPEAVLVVGWSRRVQGGVGRWMRWQSGPLATRGEVEDAWRKVDAWAQSMTLDGAGSEVAIAPLDEWQVFYYRADAWTNPLSSDATRAGAPSPAAAAPLSPTGVRSAQVPDGIRIVMSLPAGQAIAGELTRDWVRPTVGGGKS